MMQNCVELALGIRYPHLSKASIDRILATVPDNHPAQFVNPSLRRKHCPFSLAISNSQLLVLDPAGFIVRSGVLGSIFFEDYLSQEERASLLWPDDAPRSRNFSELRYTYPDRAYQLALQIRWNLEVTNGITYSFVWAVRDNSQAKGIYACHTPRFRTLGTQTFSVSPVDNWDGQNWLHLRMHLDDHIVSNAEGVIVDPLPVI